MVYTAEDKAPRQRRVRPPRAATPQEAAPETTAGPKEAPPSPQRRRHALGPRAPRLHKTRAATTRSNPAGSHPEFSCGVHCGRHALHRRSAHPNDASVPLRRDRAGGRWNRTLNRYCAEELLAREDSPPFDNSAMDGFAVRAQAVSRASQATPIGCRCTENRGPEGRFPAPYPPDTPCASSPALPYHRVPTRW